MIRKINCWKWILIHFLIIQWLKANASSAQKFSCIYVDIIAIFSKAFPFWKYFLLTIKIGEVQ
jgi:hypothetical protein